MSSKSYEDLDSDKPGSSKSRVPLKPDAKPKTSGVPLLPRSKRPMQKGGTVSPKTAYGTQLQTEARLKYQQEKGPSDTVLPPKGQRFTTEEDFPNPEYDYGDKLPKNRGIPIPMSPDESAGPPKTTSAKPKDDKHAYKVKWS